jgi:hypothetical protein
MDPPGQAAARRIETPDLSYLPLIRRRLVRALFP